VNVVYRAAVVDDAGAIAPLAVEGWRLAYSDIVPESYLAALSVERKAQRWREKMAQPSFHAMLALDGNDLVGFISCGPGRADDERGMGEVYALYVHPSHQREGIGSALMRLAEEALRNQGFQIWCVWVFTLNGKARRFYEQLCLLRILTGR